MGLFTSRRRQMGTPERALPGRAAFGMGCFWDAERTFWTLPGVHTTAVGYAGGRSSSSSSTRP